MLKIRYDRQTRLLTGWGDDVKARDKTEATAILDIIKPEPSNDYEYWQYVDNSLVRSGKSLPVPKPPPRDPLAEIDKINEKLDLLLKTEK